jgi:hypothetical protein
VPAGGSRAEVNSRRTHTHAVPLHAQLCPCRCRVGPKTRLAAPPGAASVDWRVRTGVTELPPPADTMVHVEELSDSEDEVGALASLSFSSFDDDAAAA